MTINDTTDIYGAIKSRIKLSIDTRLLKLILHEVQQFLSIYFK